MLISAIAGMGGIGKTELALQYAYQYLDTTYPGGINWIRAREDIGLQIVEFAQVCGYPSPPSPDWELVRQVQWYWQQWQKQATLTIFDDVQNYDDIAPFLPPPKSQFRVLLTSRKTVLPAEQTETIKVLDLDDAIDLLGSFSADVRSRIAADRATAEQICDWLGYLPLGLELVARYLARKRDLSLPQLLAQLNTERIKAKAMQTRSPEMTAPLEIFAAFELSWQALTADAQELAARLSLFAQAEIPWDLVAMCLPEWESEKLADVRDDSLIETSLLTRTEQDLYQLHQLLREFFALKLQAMPEREIFTTQFAQALTEIAKTIDPIVTVDQQPILTPFLPHIAAATEYASFLADDDRIVCCAGLARFYQAQSQFVAAEGWCQQSLATSEEQLGADHPATAISLNNLAVLYCSIGKYAQAEPLFIRSLAIREEQLGANHPNTATNLNNLAYLYQLVGKYAEAETLYVRSLAIREDQLGANHPNTAGSLNNLALLYCLIGKYAQAEPLFIRSLAISKEQLGANHPSTATSLNNLAGLYESNGKYAQAEPLYFRALAISEEQLGANHPDTAGSLNNLAYLYKSIGKYAQAEQLYFRAVEILEQSLGRNHPNTQRCRKNLEILRQQSVKPPIN